MPQEVRTLIDQRAQAAGGGVAYVEGATGECLTWSGLHAGVAGWDALAASLPPGSRVGLRAAGPLEAVRGFLGALATGVVVAPLDPGAGPDELDAAVHRMGLAAVVTDDPADVAVAGLAAVDRYTAGPEGPVASGRGDASAALVDGDAALLMSSSGTTGEPKLIPLTEAQLLATARAIADGHGLAGDTVGYSPLPLFHINGLVVGVLSTLVTGGRLVVDRRFSARRFWGVVADQGVTWLNLVPAIIGLLASGDAPDPAVAARVRFARSASAPLPAATARAFEDRCGVGVLETYGMTEAASQICANPLEADLRRHGSVGLPVAVSLRVVGEDGRAVPAGTQGEVQISGPRVVSTYWSPGGGASRPACGDGGWLATGDLGTLDADGYLTLTGRVDDVINRGGEKVFPREVEEVLLAEPGVSSAAVVARPHPVVGSEPVAYVVAHGGTDPHELGTRLRRRAERCLSRYKRPADIVVTASLPAGPTGKIKHAALRRAIAEGAGPTPVEAPPASDEEPSRGAPTTFPRSTTRRTPMDHALQFPQRSAKPRSTGLTMVIDGGMPTAAFADAVRSAAELIDVVKFGWGTALVTPDLDTKVGVLRELGISFYFGGTLFEKFVAQDRFGAFLDLVESSGCDTVEISNGTIDLTNTGKAPYIRKCAERWKVLSEVGFKDADRSGLLSPSMWIDAICEDLEAGAAMVITEARESGSSGICRADGELRFGLVEDIVRSGIDTTKLLWEAPTKVLQTYFVTRLGAEVNLGNIAPDHVIGLETLRLGLRADTLLQVESELAGRGPEQRWEA